VTTGSQSSRAEPHPVRTRLALVVVAALTLFVGPAPWAPASDTPQAPPPLTLVADDVLSADGRLHELTLASAALGRETEVRVLLPSGYDERIEARFPVVFLLHGVSDGEDDWTERTDVEELTADHDVIVVMPDAGPDGWYSDWIDGPRWESHHIGELVPWIDEHYRTRHRREWRAVVGNSMGGFGAMSYASRHPHLFGVAASLSGAVDNAAVEHVQPLAYELGHDYFNTPSSDVWGPFSTHEANWRGQTRTTWRRTCGGPRCTSPPERAFLASTIDPRRRSPRSASSS
jgi:S-formylglutathione hydrolase FrmB